MSDYTKSNENIFEQGSGEFKQYRMERPSMHEAMKDIQENREFAEQKAQMDEATAANDLASAVGAAASAVSNLEDAQRDNEGDLSYEYFLERRGARGYADLHGAFEVEKSILENEVDSTLEKVRTSEAKPTQHSETHEGAMDKQSELLFERFQQRSENVSKVEYGNGLGHGKSK